MSNKYLEFETVTEDEESLKASEPKSWYMKLDFYTGLALIWILKKIWMVLTALTLWAWKHTRKFLNGILKDLARMRTKFLEALAEAIGRRIGWFIGILLVVGLTMLFTANGYSITKTFSWNGLSTLWETFK